MAKSAAARLSEMQQTSSVVPLTCCLCLCFTLFFWDFSRAKNLLEFCVLIITWQAKGSQEQEQEQK